jgi:hypothetical protein
MEEAYWEYDDVQDAPWPGAGAGETAGGATDGGDAADGDSLGAYADSRDWCAWCREKFYSPTGKPICYSCRDRCS